MHYDVTHAQYLKQRTFANGTTGFCVLWGPVLSSAVAAEGHLEDASCNPSQGVWWLVAESKHMQDRTCQRNLSSIIGGNEQHLSRRRSRFPSPLNACAFLSGRCRRTLDSSSRLSFRWTLLWRLVAEPELIHSRLVDPVFPALIDVDEEHYIISENREAI